MYLEAERAAVQSVGDVLERVSEWDFRSRFVNEFQNVASDAIPPPSDDVAVQLGFVLHQIGTVVRTLQACAEKLKPTTPSLRIRMTPSGLMAG